MAIQNWQGNNVTVTDSPVQKYSNTGTEHGNNPSSKDIWNKNTEKSEKERFPWDLKQSASSRKHATDLEETKGVRL